MSPPRPSPAPVPGSEADLRTDLPESAALGGARPPDALLWEWLSAVADPEIPAVSVVDLGIVREIGWEGGTLRVTVTPTYSGCPATSAIALHIEAALARRGVRARVASRLSPPWTTDWITEAGRERLRAYGISPPRAGGPEACPRCGAARVERVSEFGSTPCKAQWRCLACLEPFDHFKCI